MAYIVDEWKALATLLKNGITLERVCFFNPDKLIKCHTYVDAGNRWQRYTLDYGSVNSEEIELTRTVFDPSEAAYYFLYYLFSGVTAMPLLQRLLINELVDKRAVIIPTCSQQDRIFVIHSPNVSIATAYVLKLITPDSEEVLATSNSCLEIVAKALAEAGYRFHDDIVVNTALNDMATKQNLYRTTNGYPS